MILRSGIFLAIALSFLFVIAAESPAITRTEANKRHADEMKVKSPQKYQEMTKGQVVDPNNCLGCHKVQQN